MGIVNVTPDSFSDGGEYLDGQAAADHALRLQDEGADLVDLGAESTRPGSKPVGAGDQLGRLIPVLAKLHGRLTVPISIDTSLNKVALACLESGAGIINDITGLRRDPEIAATCAEYGAGLVLMHMRGTPETMQSDTDYGDLFGEIHSFLHETVALAIQYSVGRENIVVDPGIGFGKSFEQNYRLLGNLNHFGDLGAGILVGPSRKAFTGEFSKLPANGRQYSSAAAVALAVLNGADIVRVHDVAEMRQVTDIIDRYREVCDGIKT